VPHRPKKVSEPDHEQSYHQFLEFSFKRFQAIKLHIICQPSPLQNLQSCQEHNTKINNSAKIKNFTMKAKDSMDASSEREKASHSTHVHMTSRSAH
jgi:hypothetical protein